MARDSVRNSQKSKQKKSMESLSKKQSIKRKRDDLKDKEQKHIRTEKNKDFPVQRLSRETITEGMVVLGEISKVTENKLMIILPGGLNGDILATDLSESYSKLLDNINETKDGIFINYKPLPELYKSGEYVTCFVKSTAKDKNEFLQLSMKPQLINRSIAFKSLNKKSIVLCSIINEDDRGYNVDIGVSTIKSFLPISCVDEKIKYFTGKQVLTNIRRFNFRENGSTLKLTTKLNQVTNPIDDAKLLLDTLVPGARIYLSVKKILSNGLEVLFGENNIGYINQLYLDKPLPSYSINTKLIGTLLYISPTSKFSYFSLTAGEAEKSKLAIGEVIQKATTLFRDSYGVVFKLPYGVRGLVPTHRTGVDIDDIPNKFVLNSTHKCRIVSYSSLENVYICSMGEKLLKEDYSLFDDAGKVEKKEVVEENSDDEGPLAVDIAISEVNNEDLKIRECGFFFNDNPIQEKIENDSSSDDDEESSEPKKKKKKLSAAERRENERQKEREIRQQEEARARNELPKSVDEFDRLVFSSPNNSYIWLQYVTFHLAQGEVDKARAVFKRAINTINSKEDDERLNMFKAWLRMEFENGTEETLQSVFQEATSRNDPEHIYPEMMTLYAEKGQYDNLEKIIKKTLSKLKENPDIWVACSKAYLQAQLKEKSRLLIDRALKSLRSNHHIYVMREFARVANQMGDKDQAHELYEKILIEHPKKVDILSAYVDMLIKSHDIDLARNVLQRISSQSLPPKKMKAIFKKFISFEEQHGTYESVENVRKMCNNYVQKCL